MSTCCARAGRPGSTCSIHVTFEKTTPNRRPEARRCPDRGPPGSGTERAGRDIPDHITVDLTGLDVGDVIHINDVKLPEGAKPTIDRNFVIANISAPSGLRSADNEEAAAEG